MKKIKPIYQENILIKFIYLKEAKKEGGEYKKILFLNFSTNKILIEFDFDFNFY